MMNRQCVALVCVLLAVGAHSSGLPSSLKVCKICDGDFNSSTLKTCKTSDGDFKNCLAEAIGASFVTLAKGNKELGMPRLEPLLIKSIHIKGNGGRVDLEQMYTDLNVHGLAGSKVLSADFDSAACSLTMDTMSEKIELKSQLKVTGKMLLFTLNGHGTSLITIKNLKTHITMPCERTQKDGKTYIKFSNVKVDFTPEKLTFDINNLIDGNEQLSAEVLKVMNDNDQDIFKEIKNDYEESFAEIFGQLGNTIFSKVPEEDIFHK